MKKFVTIILKIIISKFGIWTHLFSNKTRYRNWIGAYLGTAGKKPIKTTYCYISYIKSNFISTHTNRQLTL